MKQVTIRGVSEELDQRLKSLAKSRNESVNTTVLRILEGATGANTRLERLRRYATWNETDREEFERALAAQRTIDEELWS